MDASEAAPGTPAATGPGSSLTGLGLGPEEDRVYRLLVDRPGSTPEELAAGPDGVAAVTRALESLVAAGLAGADVGDGTARYRAAPPLLALASRVEARRAELHRTESLVSDLAERHRLAQSRVSGAPVEVLTGAAAIRGRLLSMQQDAVDEVCSMVPAIRTQVITFADNAEAAEHDLRQRGVAIRSVVARGWLERPGTAEALTGMVAQGQQISVVDDLPIKLVVVDRRVALLPLDPDREDAEPAALVVHRTGLVVAMASLFEQYFARGRRLRSHASGGVAPGDGREPRIDAVDRRILALLHIGLNDSAIARHLGMGYRTVQRRLQALMGLAGAATRFQLGWYAAESGWIEETASGGGGRPPAAGEACEACEAHSRRGAFTPPAVP
ncbi:helix-turn-helix transcriptional regulator [Streptacidiphilus sp. ASG 303]|uniref:helix-turn-helix domain-containing protein n=1 Tax=Streptacidiphilus sp. ASG 303 TaxID=2896847 RepID=UPI001E653E91|nr:helix-turn-helix domain-containing protein [Streptacidiphilus sp. ASG 303]MCD0484013.1 helix-turn-helix transcriptional regulator [Streptacidiphilus sp. ASG 303]